MKEKLKQSTIKQAFWTQKQQQRDNIVKQNQEAWTIKAISTLFTYKSHFSIKHNTSNRMIMLDKWVVHSGRPTLPCSPTVTTNNGADTPYKI
jgi:hypothetical protein